MPFTRFECSILVFSFIMSPLIFALAYDLLDLNASINIKWDIMSWTPEGYVDINNAQRLAHVMFLTCEVSNHSQVTWTITCTYSSILVSRNPNCCVSLSSFYNPVITPYPTCSYG
ncbi:Uncharacterized protein TCM_014317 [Theobroma cacao]|uniref:Uncharacterized protein n=1 Tax=Theobroma cacao TaxID=3641 RepID=A0A061FYJ5_THECC|nr:Uncharacterized protein TCM_014317 [Theobroma cacao]